MTPLAITLHPFDEAEAVGAVYPAVVRGDALLARAFDAPGAADIAARWLPRMRDAWASLREGDGDPWSCAVNFAVGVLAGFSHPVYFLGDLGLSYWRGVGECPLRPYTRSMAVLAARVPELGAAVSEIPDGFAGAGSAGAFVPATSVVILLRELERRPWIFADRLAHAGYDAVTVLATVLETLHYARARHLGVLELTNAVDPAERLAMFPAAHLRGAWGQGLLPESRARIERALTADARR